MEPGSLSAVYFRRLGRDAYKPKARPKLLDTLKLANDNYVQLTAETHGFGGASHVLALANAEAAKEQNMLRQIFGVDLNIDLSQPGAIKQLTEAINDVFQFRAVYERNKALIQDENFSGQKGVFSYFHTYFIKAFHEEESNIMADIKSRMLANKSLGAGEAAKLAFTAAIPKMIDKAINQMFGEADLELKDSMDQQHKEAYREILSFIQRFPGHNMFTEGMARAWGLDKVAEEFSKAFSTQHRTPKKATQKRARNMAEAETKKSMSTKGGYSLEVLIDQCLAMTAAGLNGIPNVSANAAGVHAGAGAIDARADNVFHFNMDGSRIDQAFQEVQNDNSSRESAVQAFSKLGEDLSRVKDGFIVYVNDKNYTLGKNFRGMSAGTAWNLYQIQGLLGGIIGDIDQLVYNLLQTGADAIRPNDTGNASKILAEGIAYYLFDDYTTIGNPGGNAIHVMGLQGMLIPLSVFLFALGNALGTIEANPSTYVRVTITPGPTDASNENAYGEENWERQYETSMSKTKISIHFLENFVGFVRGYL